MKNKAPMIVGTVAFLIAFFLGAAHLYKRNLPSKNETLPQNTALIREWSPSIGPAMANVVVVEFLDPECESCRAMHPILKQVLKDYQGKIRYVLRYMPFHQNSVLAASWLEATRDQNKYWEALDVLFEKQAQWAAHHQPQPEQIPLLLKSIGVDIHKAALDKDRPDFSERIEKDKRDGQQLGVDGTPTFFVNGRQLINLGDEPLRQLIDEELKKFQR